MFCWRIFRMKHKKSSGTGDTTATGSGRASQIEILQAALHRRKIGNQSGLTADISAKSAITSKTCSQSLKTGGVWQPDMTDALIPSCPQFILLQFSSSISKNESGAWVAAQAERPFITYREGKVIRQALRLFPHVPASTRVGRAAISANHHTQKPVLKTTASFASCLQKKHSEEIIFLSQP